MFLWSFCIIYTIIFFCFTRLIFCKIAIKLLSTIKTLVVNHQNTISFISHNENTIFKNYMQVSCCESLEFLVPQFFWISWITIIQKLTSSKKLWNIILIHTSYEYINKILSPRTCEKIKIKIGPNKIQIFQSYSSVYMPINSSFKPAANKIFELQSHKTNSIWKHDKHTSSICLVLTLACSSSFMTVARSFSVRCFSSWRTFSSSRASLTSSVSWSSSDPAPASSRALESSVNKLNKKKRKVETELRESWS